MSLTELPGHARTQGLRAVRRAGWCAALWAGAALAQPAAGGPGPGPGPGHAGHPGPPPQALAACKGLAAGKACSFVGHAQQSLAGTCWAPEGLPLACRPKDAPPLPGIGASRPPAR